MLWFGVLVLCMGKTETMSCQKKIETDTLMYLVVIEDPISPVLGM